MSAEVFIHQTPESPLTERKTQIPRKSSKEIQI